MINQAKTKLLITALITRNFNASAVSRDLEVPRGTIFNHTSRTQKGQKELAKKLGLL